MMGLPRRWIRQLGYIVIIIFAGLIILMVASKQNVMLDDYLPKSIIPSFFQPASDSFIIDVAIKSCLKIKSKNENCGVPGASEGLMGDLHESGHWVRLNKDLSLGTSWIGREYLSYKKVNSDALNGKILKPANAETKEKQKRSNEANKNQVIVDIAISNPFIDSKIQGNEKLNIPLYILNEFHLKKVFNDEDHTKLVDKKKAGMKGEKDKAMTLEKDKIASHKVNIKLEQDVNAKSTSASSEQKEKVIDPKETESESEKEDKEDVENKGDKDTKIDKRQTETTRNGLKLSYAIPTKDELNKAGWRYKSNGIWLKYGNAGADAITGIDILFGNDAVDPRPNWMLIDHGPLSDVKTPSDRAAFLSIRKGPKLDYNKKTSAPLKINKNGKFKILQVADLHFSTGFGKCRDPSPEDTKKGCKADLRTFKFLENVLDLEKPDFVVLTGDQIFGEESPDSETSVFKALNPFIKRKIPFAVTMGNHDDEGSLSRSEIMSLSSNLPYCLSSLGPKEIAGMGNYALTVEGASSHNSAMTLYFLDTHKYSQNPKVTPGYDWLKESQLKWLEQKAASLRKSVQAYSHIPLSMAFFHIPLPEYRNLQQPLIGDNKEGVTAPRYNTGARSILGRLGVQVVSVGHDHCNDYCLQDIDSNDSENKMWLCYGGGSGEGGYGGYGGYIRRLRIFEIDTAAGEIKSWKRKESDPNADFDHQTLVSGGNIANLE